jgi:nitronate monooxygenase
VSPVLDTLAVPIVQAPMAGGASTVALAAAVSEAGGLGFLAAGYKTAGAVEEEVRALRAATPAPFGVNVFVPGAPSDPESYAAHVSRIEELGLPAGEPRFDDDDFAAKVDVLCDARVPVVSFVFGAPPADAVARLRAAGTEVWATVTSPEEAGLAAAAGADVLVAQGAEAGAHRGTFDDAAAGEPLGLLALLALLAAQPLPVVAAGGIATGGAIAAVLAAGARAAALGTAFLLCPEAGTHPVHREALQRGGETAMTRAFTGRRARGIVNGFMQRHPDAPSAYPHIHHLTAPLRAAARAAGDADRVNLWAGASFQSTRAVPAAEVVAQLRG